MKLAAVVMAAATTAACGSKPQTSTTPGDNGASAALPDVPFDKLDQEQRAEFMKQKVVPEMRVIFQNHDAKDYADFGCATCHGPQAKEGHFDMPNPGLPKLNFKDMSKFKAEDVEWMKQQVMPTMGRILGLPLYSPENPKGFGCLACHTQEGQ